MTSGELADWVKGLYANINNQEQANEVPNRVYESVAHYLELNEYDKSIGTISHQGVARIALVALDVMRLADGGEFEQFGVPHEN